MKKLITIILSICTITPAVFANDQPYFTGNTEVFEKQILVGQKFRHSIDTIVPMRIDSMKSDSSFTCGDNSCVWNYTYTYDTTLKIIFDYSENDSFTFVDTLVFSFFDTENDSCRFSVLLFDSSGKKVFPDSVWGDLYARPGTGKRIYFTSHLPTAGYWQFIIGMNQIENSADTVFDTIAAGTARVTLEDLVATDSSFLSGIHGKWRPLFCTRYEGKDTATRPMDNPSNYAVASDTMFLVYIEDSLVSGDTLELNKRAGFKIPPTSNIGVWGSGYLLLGDTLVMTVRYIGPKSTTSEICIYVRDQNTPFQGNPKYQERIQFIKILKDNAGFPVGIQLSAAKPSAVELSLYDLKGREVLQPVRANVQAGSHTIPLSNRALSRQTYLLKIKIDGKTYGYSAIFIQ